MEENLASRDGSLRSWDSGTVMLSRAHRRPGQPKAFDPHRKEGGAGKACQPVAATAPLQPDTATRSAKEGRI